jgi:predicted MFS family arabinose efflux permease
MTTSPKTASADVLPKTSSAVAALLFGNFVIGMGVMIVPGMLNDLSKDLNVSIPIGGQLISTAGLVMALGAPVIAATTSQVNRRMLLCIAQLCYCLGALLCAIAPNFASLLPLRAIMVLGAAIFTPQAAATIGLLVPPEKRSAAVTTIFMGWSVSAVLGMPVGNLIAVHIGWRYGFCLIALIALLSMIWVWKVIPNGLTVPKLSFQSWRNVQTSPKLMTILLVTLVSSSGQFTVLAYVAPYLIEHMRATPMTFSLLMALNGIAGVIGTFWVSRNVGQLGVEKLVKRSCALLALGLFIWALETLINGHTGGYFWPSWILLTLGCAAWGGGSFATNSIQQARLASVNPSLASASISLNSSAMYTGQAIGALLGALLLSNLGYSLLPWAATLLLLCALALSNLAGGLSAERR